MTHLATKKAIGTVLSSEFTQHPSGHWSLTGDANVVVELLERLAAPPVTGTVMQAAQTIVEAASPDPAETTELWRRTTLTYRTFYNALAYAEARGWITRTPQTRRGEKTYVSLTLVGAARQARNAPPPPPRTATDPRGGKRELPVLDLTKDEMRALLEYSATIPTGKVIGKRWKSRLDKEGTVWCVGEYAELSPEDQIKWPGEIAILSYFPSVDGGTPGVWRKP